MPYKDPVFRQKYVNEYKRKQTMIIHVVQERRVVVSASEDYFAGSVTWR